MHRRYILDTSKGDLMRHRHSGCHPRGRIEIDVPEALFAMGAPLGRLGSLPLRIRRQRVRRQSARRTAEPAHVRIRRASARAPEADRRRAAPRLRPHPCDRGSDGRRICAEPGRRLSDPDVAPGHGADRGSGGRGTAQAVPGDGRRPRASRGKGGRGRGPVRASQRISLPRNRTTAARRSAEASRI